MTEKIQLMNLFQSDSQMQWMGLPPVEHLDLEKFVDGHCTILHMGKEKVLFIVLFAWILPMEQKMFHHFPEVIYVDTVSHTNKDKRPLLIISGRDSYEKIFIFLRAFLLNKRAWVFQWMLTIDANIVPIIYLIKSKINYN